MTHQTYLPSLHGGGEQYAQQLAHLIMNDERQERTGLVVDDRLVAAAQAKAESLPPLNELRHTVAGVSANENVANHGYALPDWYPPHGNSVESLSVGQRTPQDALEAFWGSEGHRAHVFGQTDFYRGQTRLGVGYTPQQSPQKWGHWWAIITAHAPRPEGSRTWR